MRLKAVILLLAVVALGCNEQVIVTDETGKPVVDADVTPQTANQNGAAVKTDLNGVASIPTAISYIDCVVWVVVEKDGYETVNQHVPAKWPLKVVLKAATQPTTVP